MPEFGALLIVANLGPTPSLRSFNKIQAQVRTFLLRCADYECSKLNPDVNIVPDSWYGNVDYEHVAFTDWELDGFTALIDPRLPDEHPIYPDILGHLASVAVNPWLEMVISTGGTVALARAGWAALANANKIFDFFIRVKSWRHEHQARVSHLRQMAIRERCDTVVKIIDHFDGSGRGVAAAHLISSALDLDVDTLNDIRMEQISIEEVERKRSQIEDLATSEIVDPATSIRTMQVSSVERIVEGPSNGQLAQGGD